MKARRATPKETEKFRKAIEKKLGVPREKRASTRFHPCGKCELCFDFCRCEPKDGDERESTWKAGLMDCEHCGPIEGKLKYDGCTWWCEECWRLNHL